MSVLFDGLAYGNLLFLINIGLSVMVDLMNFINLAYGAFAMTGGYVCVVLMNRLGVSFLATLPVAFVVIAVIGFVLKRALCRWLCRVSPLDQVLFSIALVLMAMAGATYVWGPSQQPVELPETLHGQWPVLDSGLEVRRYHLFLIGVVIMLMALLAWLIGRICFGAQVRASVGNQQASAGLGTNVGLMFSVTFALGLGLAGPGEGLGIGVLEPDPAFPIGYMVYLLLVMVVGGAGSIEGTLLAVLALGVFDVADEYYVSDVGVFVIYGLMVVLLVLPPGGPLGRRA